MEDEKVGYHKRSIRRGVFGELSKIEEEVAELADADEQGVRVMVLIELSDLVGAIRGYLLKRFGDSVTLDDLTKMADVTRRAFESGARN